MIYVDLPHSSYNVMNYRQQRPSALARETDYRKAVKSTAIACFSLGSEVPLDAVNADSTLHYLSSRSLASIKYC